MQARLHIIRPFSSMSQHPKSAVFPRLYFSYDIAQYYDAGAEQRPELNEATGGTKRIAGETSEPASRSRQQSRPGLSRERVLRGAVSVADGEGSER